MSKQPDLFSALPPEQVPSQPETLSVSGFNERVASFLKGAFPGKIRIQGFVSGFNRSFRRGGHIYFELNEKDPSDESRVLSKIGLVAWRGTRSRLQRALKSLGGEACEIDDLQVYFEVTLNYWVPGGRLSLVVEGIDLEASLGAMKLDRDRILRLLAEEGLLDQNRQRTLPAVPLRLGLITSAESAAYHDFTKELSLAGVGFKLGCYNARVQGVEQEADMQGAFAWFERHAADWDAIILIRGGGSRSDLVGFDSEQLARTIAGFPLPVLTGIGHEIDRSIADEVAYHSLKTPTAVAQFLMERIDAWLDEMDDLSQAIRQQSEMLLTDARFSLTSKTQRLQLMTERRLARGRERLNVLSAGMPGLARHRLRMIAPRLNTLVDRLKTGIYTTLSRRNRELDHREERLRLLDPLNILQRGFSITRRGDGTLLTSIAEVKAGDDLRTRLADGIIESKSNNVLPLDEA
ncbi:MAG: exodeoxyribonuclease VII large subunit [bacterium]|nr:exodeoxyribonuclease VII large subunit [bacterium]